MKKFLLAITAFCAIIPVYSQTVFKDYIDGQIYVKFHSGALKQVLRDDPNNIPFEKLTSVSRILDKYGVTKAVKPFYQADDDDRLPYIIQFDFSKANKVTDFINDLSQMEGIEYAEKVPAMHTFTVPNDPLYGTNQTTYMNQIQAPTAWDVYFGNSNITVAIVDNAVRYTHVDLLPNTYTNTIEAAGVAGVDDDNNGYIDDINGYDVADNDNNPSPTNNAMNHGTHCAGIAGARNNNGVGIGSIGWNIKIIPVKCTTNGGSTTSIQNGYGGIIYAAKAKARVISCSWGGPGFSAAAQTVIDYAWSKGCIIIAAAGNDGNNTLHYPGAYNNVYCVASCNSSNVKSTFSCYGQSGNAWVDITAPGENIYSTLPNSGSGTYGNQSGTSMATPMVAGLAGLMLSYSPLMTQQDVLNCISSTAANIYTISGNFAYSPGQQLGAGRINATAAMNCAGGYLTAAPIANFFTLTKNVCPNIPVIFQDSSLYMYTPSVWSWTFQSGTPATSTSSNPSVQWAAPGTYSVGLTVSTPNGSNTATKISYITVAGPISLPLYEGFQAPAFLPPNWTSYNIGNDNIFFERITGVNLGGFGTSSACATFDNYNIDAGGDRDEMRTPKYDFSNVVTARLKFDVAYKQYDNQYSDTLKVKLSTNCGSTWTEIYSKGGSQLSTSAGTLQASKFTPTSSQWRRDSIDITALSAGQGNVMASFVNHGRYGQALYLDNINLFFPAPTTTFVVPPPVCPGVPVTYTNNTSGASSYTWTFQGGSPSTSTLTNPVVSYASGGVYTATLAAQNGTTISMLTKTISINPTPTIAVNNQTICSGGTATITASGASTYTWSTSFVGNPLVVSPGSNTTYTVTGTSSGCSGSSTVNVTIGSFLSVYITPSQPTVCSSGTSTLVASGATSYTWNTGPVASSIVVTPTANTTYSIIGSNGSCTGTTLLTVTVIPTPAIDLSVTPSASVCLGQSVTLSASGFYSSYTWETPTVNASSITVSPGSSTDYTVYGSGSGGCNTSSVVSVIIKPLPVAVITTTDASCSGCPDGVAQVSVTSGVGPYTYQWIPVGGTQSLVSGFTPGCYSVNINSANGCTSQQTMCIGFSTDLKNQQTGNLQSPVLIYPNPAHHFFTIESKGKNFSYKLYNSLGQIIVERANNHNLAFVNTSDIAKGVYMIVVDSGEEKILKKLVID